MSQTTYNMNQDIAREGLKNGIGFQDIHTKSNDTENLFFGKFVAIVNDLEAKAPVLATDVTNGHGGFVLASQDVECQDDGLAAHYPMKKPASILKKGMVWVKTEDAAVEGGGVYIRWAGTGLKGSVRATAVTNEASLLPNAKFASSAGADGFVLVDLNLV